MEPQRIDFRRNTQQVAPRLRAATQKNTATAVRKRAESVAPLGNAYWQTLRQAAHDVRLHAITHLDEYLPQVEARVSAAGGVVHWASDAAEARRIVLAIARAHQVRRVVKVKSMLSEEIELNDALRDAGIQSLETDLGEYLVQLDGSRPSHPTAPALHMTKEDIAALYREKLGIAAPPDPAILTEIARVKLRQEFLAADMGISGGNFLIAETGTLVLVTNEGNGRMSTGLPPVHIAIVGIEKVIPTWDALAVLLQLLPRSTTGQALTSYLTTITGTWDGGPREFHLVLLDNGRTRILRDERARETLLCIRCGACANICPVYNAVGGHAYAAVYTGPIGAIVTPQLLGTERAGDLAYASSLCGACNDVCPVKIPITDILLHLRHRVAEGDATEPALLPAIARTGAQIGEAMFSTPWLYRLGARLSAVAQARLQRGDWLSNLPPPLNRWTSVRPFPVLRNEFRAWWSKRRGGEIARGSNKTFGSIIVLSILIAFVAVIFRKRGAR